MNPLFCLILISLALVGCGRSDVRHYDHDRARANPWVGWYVSDPAQWQPEEGYVSAAFFGGRLEWTVVDRHNPQLRWMASGRFIPGKDRMQGVWTCESTAVFRVGPGKGSVLFHQRADGSGGARAEAALVKTFLETSSILGSALPRGVIECRGEVVLRREVSKEGRLRIVPEAGEKAHRLLFHGANAFTESVDALEQPSGVLSPWRHQKLFKGNERIYPAPTNHWIPVAQSKRFFVTPHWKVSDDGENWVLSAKIHRPIHYRDFRVHPSALFQEVLKTGRWHVLVPHSVDTTQWERSKDGSHVQVILPKTGADQDVTVEFEAAFPNSPTIEQDVRIAHEDGRIEVGETRLIAQP